MLLHMFLNLCAAKNFGKNYPGTSNIDFGKEIHKKDREFR